MTTFSLLSEALIRDGFCVLKGALSPEEVTRMRQTALGQKDLMARTRSAEHARHLAGFDRFDSLAPIGETMSRNKSLKGFLETHFAITGANPIGLTDITINRSQHWHTDLLRGPYAHFLQDVDVWGDPKGACVKALAYLQDGKSLRIVRGSHAAETPLDDTALEALAHSKDVEQLEIAAGDIVMMDLRALHRGSTDAEMAAPHLADDPKVLVSTVYGANGAALSEAMKAGNTARMADWDSRHLAS